MDRVSLDDAPSGGRQAGAESDSVAEVVISTSNYSAVFGKAANRVTQITSKSGTNKFHGSPFEQYQGSGLNARPEFQNQKDKRTNINGITGFGDDFAPVGFAQNDFHRRDMVSITHGKHFCESANLQFRLDAYTISTALICRAGIRT